MKTIQTKKEYVSATVDIDGELDIPVDGYVHYYVDTQYGADADGNRGHTKIIIDDVTDVQAYDINGDEIELTECGEEAAIEALSIRFIER
jgi:hypothetical protein